MSQHAMTKTLRITRFILVLALALGCLYFLCLLFPQPFFRYHMQERNIAIYTNQAPPPNIPTLLDSVGRLLDKSPLNDPHIHHRVFICQDIRLFGFLTRGRTNLAGLCDDRLSRNVFIRPADLTAERILPPPGWPLASDNRPLSYFIAHELTHSLESHFAGRWNLHIPVWLWEGYADYIGLGGTKDLAHDLILYKEGVPEMNPAGGQYGRYALYVTYLLDYKHLDIKYLLKNPPSEEGVDSAVRRLVF